MKFKEARQITTPFGLTEEYDGKHHHHEKVAKGPSNWDEVRKNPSAFGPEEDYEMTFSRDIDKWIFWPRSWAAREWCYAKFPEDAPRYGDFGFVIDDPQTARTIRLAAERDSLMSFGEYTEAMEEMNALQHSGEGK